MIWYFLCLKTWVWNSSYWPDFKFMVSTKTSSTNNDSTLPFTTACKAIVLSSVDGVWANYNFNLGQSFWSVCSIISFPFCFVSELINEWKKERKVKLVLSLKATSCVPIDPFLHHTIINQFLCQDKIISRSSWRLEERKQWTLWQTTKTKSSGFNTFLNFIFIS